MAYVGDRGRQTGRAATNTTDSRFVYRYAAILMTQVVGTSWPRRPIVLFRVRRLSSCRFSEFLAQLAELIKQAEQMLSVWVCVCKSQSVSLLRTPVSARSYRASAFLLD